MVLTIFVLNGALQELDCPSKTVRNFIPGLARPRFVRQDTTGFLNARREPR